MSHEAWILFAGLALSNFIALVAGIIHIATRLTRIETDLKWVINGCNRCQENK